MAFWPNSADTATCEQWETQFSTKQTVLRDNGDLINKLAMNSTYQIIVMDRYLKITYRGDPAYDSTVKAAVDAQLATLK